LAAGDPAASWLAVLLPVTVWLAVLSTIYSGLQYVAVAIKHLAGSQSEA